MKESRMDRIGRKSTTEAQLRNSFKKMDDIFEMLRNKGIIDLNIAEEEFYREIKDILKQKNFGFSSVRKKTGRKGSGEYDIVAVGEDRVFVIEVKRNTDRQTIDDFLSHKIPKYRQKFPGYRLIGGVGSRKMQRIVRCYAQEKGLYVLIRYGYSSAIIANRKNFKAKEF